jgi:hypothetical protein
MSDPYRLLGETLVAAARRREASPSAPRWRVWLSRRVNVMALSLVLVLGGGAAAIAASGLLNGSPVAEPQGTPSANAGTGVPTAGGGRLLALRAPDPEGGLPWGMQLVHTTRGETCVQIGRVQDGELGQLGIDGAFGDDGRFHPLSADTLPNYTSGYGDITCLLPGEVMLGYAATEDRNAEWGVGAKPSPSAQQLRAISWGLLGPHAVSVTYRTSTGPRTIPVSPATGAFMIVEPVHQVPRFRTIGGFQSGSIVGHQVGLALALGGREALSTIVFRFGSLVCSIGAVPPGSRRCSSPRPIPISAYRPTRSLHEPVRATAVVQPHALCARAFLLDPCYRALIEFKAPYAVTNAGSEYSIEASSNCHNATPSSWPVDRDISRSETIRTMSLGYFNCLADKFKVQYRDIALEASSSRRGSPSVIVGAGTLTPPRR